MLLLQGKNNGKGNTWPENRSFKKSKHSEEWIPFLDEFHLNRRLNHQLLGILFLGFLILAQGPEFSITRVRYLCK